LDVFVIQIDINWQSLRDEGIARSQAHAEALDPDWPKVAYGMLEEFCKARRGCHFTSEDVRRWSSLHGFDSPVPKAWGGVFQKASRRGLIKKRLEPGIAKARHGSPCPLWEVA
jgi:hypothetical protein